MTMTAKKRDIFFETKMWEGLSKLLPEETTAIVKKLQPF